LYPLPGDSVVALLKLFDFSVFFLQAMSSSKVGQRPFQRGSTDTSFSDESSELDDRSTIKHEFGFQNNDGVYLF
jgi:hypothetical protein